MSAHEPVIHVICCVCKRDLGTKPCEPEMAGKVSHGLCPGDSACRRTLKGTP